MKKYLVLPFIFILILACRQVEYYNLDHGKWFYYSANDTLIYKTSNTSMVDSFFVYKTINGQRMADNDIHEEYLNIIIRKINSRCDNCDDMNIARERDFVTLSMNNMQFLETINYSDTAGKLYAFGNDTIRNVYLAKNTLVAAHDTDIIAIYYNDIYGIVRYDQKNGTIFELQPKHQFFFENFIAK